MRLMVLLTALACSACMSMRGTKHTYRSAGVSGEVGGARVNLGFRPEGTRPGSVMVSAMVMGAGFATFDGPFRWRIEALGEEGVHQGLIVHRIHTKTEKSGRDAWYPSGDLGRRVDFHPLDGQPGKARARYLVPGLLEVLPEQDGRLDVKVDLSVVRKDRTVRKMIGFSLTPSVQRQDELIFIPKEIVDGIGKPLDAMEDPMWD